MKREVTFRHSHARVPWKDISRSIEKIAPYLKEVSHLSTNSKNPESCLALCDNKELHKMIHSLVKEINREKPIIQVVIGIGGSNLGMQAVQQLVHGKLHNEYAETKVLYADTVDTDELAEIQDMMEIALKKKERVILTVISKSGTTIETIANFSLLYSLIKKNRKHPEKDVIVITEVGSPLGHHAITSGHYILTMPKAVGGRYSVLSAVGLFPLALAGIDIDELLEGARYMQARCFSQASPAAMSAAIRHYHAIHTQTIQDLFLFGNDFKSLGKWYRQLFAESLGKGCDLNKKVCIGITPTYSIGSTDMHSIAQLYLGGPFDKFTTFVSVEKSRTNLKIPANQEMLPHLQGKSMEDIMKAIYHGVTHSFAENNRAFTEVILSDKSEYAIGQFLQLQMTEVILLGRLLHVNPFDQPDIESYKEETRRLLKK